MNRKPKMNNDTKELYIRILTSILFIFFLIFVYSWYKDSVNAHYTKEYQDRARLELSRELDVDLDEINDPYAIKVKKYVKVPEEHQAIIKEANLIQFFWRNQGGKSYSISLLEYVSNTGITYVERTEREIE